MRRAWIVLTLVLLAAVSPEEARRWRVAQTAFHDRLYDFAERQLREFLDKFPRSDRRHEVRWLLAQAQVEQGKWAAAVDTLQAGVAAGPDPDGQFPVDGYLFWRAEALVAGEQYAAARDAYEELIERHPGSDHRADAQYGLAYVQLRQSQYPAARRTIEELTRLPLREALARQTDLLRGQVLLALEEFDAAEEIFDALVKREENQRVGFQARRWRGELWARRGDAERALRNLTLVTEAYDRAPHQPVDAQLAAEAWVSKGWVHWRQEQFPAAIEAFARALTLARAPGLQREALVKLAEAYVRAGQEESAIERLRQFIQERPADPIAADAQWTIADLLFGQDDFAGALAELTKLVGSYPQSAILARAQYRAGWCAVRLERLPDALSHFQAAFTTATATDGPVADPALAEEALFKVADLQFALGQTPEAVANYQRLISLFPGTPRMDQVLFQLGLAYQRMQDAEAAEQVFISLVTDHAASPYAPQAQFQIGLLHVALRQEEAARAAFAQVVEKFPASDWVGPAQLATGESFYRDGQYAAALAEYQKLIDATPDSELAHRAFYNRGWCLTAQGHPEQTLTEFTEWLSRQPDAPLAAEIRFWIGDYYYRQKDFVRAQEQFQTLAKNYPRSALADSAEYFAARAAFHRQDYKPAIELFETLVKNFPESPLRCDARFGQGDAFTILGEFDNALQVFDTLTREFPDCWLACEAQGRKADCLYTLQRYEEAVATYRAALSCARDADPHLRSQLGYKLGQAFEKWGKPAEAVEQYLKVVYEAAAAPDPTLPAEQLWVGRAGLAAATLHEQQQQWREAIVVYERLIQLSPDLQALLEDRIRKIRARRGILF